MVGKGRFSKLETPGAVSLGAEAKRVAETQAAQEELVYDARYYCAQAEEAFFAGDYRRALQLYSRAVQREAASLEGWTGQIFALLALGEKREALAWINRGLTILPEQPRIISLQGLVFAHMGSTNRGLQCSDYAMAQGAADPYVWLCRGEILTLASNPNALFCMEKAMECRHAGEWQIPAHIGLFYLDQRTWPLAEKYLAQAVAEMSTFAPLWYRLGVAQLRMAKTEAARQSLETALRLQPNLRGARDELEALTRSPWLARVLAWFTAKKK